MNELDRRTLDNLNKEYEVMDKYDASMPEARMKDLVYRARMDEDLCFLFAAIVILWPIVTRLMGH